MSKRNFWILAAALLLPAQAALADMSWYLGAGGSITRLRTKDFATWSGICSPPSPGTCGQVLSGEFVDTPIGWQIYGGANFTENFGLLIKYSDSGKGKDTWGTFTTVDDGMGGGAVNTEYAATGDMQMDGFTIYLTQTVPLGEKWAYGFQVGWTQQDMEFNWSSNPAAPGYARTSYKDDASGFAFGALLRYKFTQHIGVNTEFEWLLLDFNDLIDRPIKLNLNLEYYF